MLHWVDLVIIAIIALSIVTGFIRGFVKELIALGVWILAVWVAFHYAESLDPWLQHYIQEQVARKITAFILLMLAVLIAGGIVNVLLGLILKHSGLSSVDRILGMGFGFVRGVFIVALIMVVIQMTSLPWQQYARDSRLYARFDPLVVWMYSLVPDFIKQIKFFDLIDKASGKPEKTSLLDLSSDLEFSDG